MNKLGLISLLRNLAKGHKKLNKGNSVEPFVYGRYGTLRARVGEKILKCSYWRGANERERERVANYLELPNNLMTFLQKNHFFLHCLCTL